MNLSIPTPASARELAPAAVASAASTAALYWRTNLRAVETTQPRLATSVARESPVFRPTFARDGSLTAFDADGKWWRGCSVPQAAASAMLSALDMKGRVACLLAPTLAAHVDVALTRSRPDQAIIALCPDLRGLHVLLHCADFSQSIQAHRLWFAWGESWATELSTLFNDHLGLATPASFIRLPITAAEDVDRLVGTAQAVFAEVNAGRAAALARGCEKWRGCGAKRPRLCVVAPSHFRLWDDAGAVLAGALRASSDADVACFDPDRPSCSSALALQSAARETDALIAADISRADLPGVLPHEMPMLTWVTRAASIPPFSSAGPSDGLVVAGDALRRKAADAGWPAARIAVGGWPTLANNSLARPRPALAIVADTRPLVMPEPVTEFSSHQLLWERIAAELESDPFAVNEDAAGYLERRMRRLGVSSEGFDASLFLERLILPVYAQSIARLLLREGLPLRLFGAGWDQIDEFQRHSAGRVTSPSDLARIRDDAAALVHVWPTSDLHPIQRMGRPVVLLGPSLNRQRFLHAARSALTCGTVPDASTESVSIRQFLALMPG